MSEEAAGFLDWPGLRAVYAVDVERIVLRAGQVTHVSQTTQYGFTSLAADPFRLLALHRSHWAVENRCFRQRDEALREDRRNLRNPNAIHLAALLHDAALALLRLLHPTAPLPAIQLRLTLHPLAALAALLARL